MEAAYVNFGEPEDTVLGQKLKADGDGISAFAVGFLAIGPVDLFAKVGLISWDSKIAGEASTTTAPTSPTASAHSSACSACRSAPSTRSSRSATSTST